MLLLCFCIVPAARSQNLSLGFNSGVNFSDIHGNTLEGKWAFKPGPSQRVTAEYSLNRYFGIRAGLDLSTLYYEHSKKDYINDGPVLFEAVSSLLPYYYSRTEDMNFSFLTLPLAVSFTIPAKPLLKLSAGYYYSWLLSSDFNYGDEDMWDAGNDFGFIYSASASFPLAGDFSVSLGTSYMSGRKEFTGTGTYRHGRFDVTAGLRYEGLLKRKEDHDLSDTMQSSAYLTCFAGMNMAGNSGGYFPDKYSSGFGVSAGFSLTMKMGGRFHFTTGISFDQAGYALRDSSESYLRYLDKGNDLLWVDTKTTIDYLVMPALLTVHAGRNGNIYLNAGPYLGIKLNARCTGTVLQEIISGGSYTSYYLSKTTVYDDLEGPVRDNDFGYQLGGGIAFPVTGGYSIDISLQYRQGFTEVLNKSWPELSSPSWPDEKIIRNRSLSVRMGVRLPVNK